MGRRCKEPPHKTLLKVLFEDKNYSHYRTCYTLLTPIYYVDIIAEKLCLTREQVVDEVVTPCLTRHLYKKVCGRGFFTGKYLECLTYMRTYKGFEGSCERLIVTQFNRKHPWACVSPWVSGAVDSKGHFVQQRGTLITNYHYGVLFDLPHFQ